MTEDIYQLIWSYHHLLLDGWSIPLLLKDFYAAYEAFCRGQEPELEQRRPYRDYIAWLRRQDLAQAEAFWRRTLQGLSAPTPLGVDHQDRGTAPGDEYAIWHTPLSAVTTRALDGLSRRLRVTPNTLLLGAWALLLHRYCGEPEVMFGTTVSGRPAELAGSERMVGLFINTLPLRVRVALNATLGEWLLELQAQQVELRLYEYSPLAQVQRWSAIPRGLPLFESIVVFENYPADGTGRTRTPWVFQRTNYPLTLVVERHATLSLRVGYERRRFDDQAITRLLGHLQTLLEGLLVRPRQLVRDVPLLSPTERALLARWSHTRSGGADTADTATDACIHEQLSAQAARTPDAVVLVFDPGATTCKCGIVVSDTRRTFPATSCA